MRYLKEGGYEVHWLGKNDCLAPGAFESSVTKIYGAGQGVAGSSQNVFQKGEPGYYSFLNTALDGPPRDAIFYERAIEYIKNRRVGDAPFFMFLATGFPTPSTTCPSLGTVCTTRTTCRRCGPWSPRASPIIIN